MKRSVATPAVVLGAHLAAAMWIAFWYRRSNNPYLLLAVSALPLAQASLLALWGVRQRGPSCVRATMVAIAATSLWAVECHSLNLHLSDDRCAAYALAFAVQIALLGGLLAAMRLGGWLSRRRRGDGERRVQFSVRSLLGWVTATALILAAWKLVLIRADWPTGVVKGGLFLFGGGVGAYNATFALIVAAATVWGRRWYWILAWALLALVLVGAVAFSQSFVLKAVFGTNGRLGPAAWMMHAGFQAVYLLATLVPIRLYRHHQRSEPAHGTSTCREAHHAGLPDTA